MTRQQFIDDVNYWWELIDFCNDNGCSYCDDVYSEEIRDEHINECLVDMARNADSWLSLLDTLGNITIGYDYYKCTDYGDWEGLDDYEFRDYKDDVLEWGDNNDIWEEDEEEPLHEDDADDVEFEPEPISLGELMGACSSQLHQICQDTQNKVSECDEAFEEFVAGYITIQKGELSKWI